MEEAFASAKETKETNAVREQFVAEVGFESWEDAVATVPQNANKLKKLNGCKGKEPAFKVVHNDFAHNSIFLLCNAISKPL